MSLKLTEIEFGALLSYCPRGDSPEIQNARDVMLTLKTDRFLLEPPIQISEWIAKTVSTQRKSHEFSKFFKPKTIFVPCPPSSLMQPDSLWVPKNIALALVKYGLGKEVSTCLVRNIPTRKSATSPAHLRPTPKEHYDSIIVQGSLSEPSEIVLIDDIVTRGSTILESANRLFDLYPQAHIQAFTAMRTMSNEVDFIKLIDPCAGSIELRPTGDSIRRP